MRTLLLLLRPRAAVRLVREEDELVHVLLALVEVFALLFNFLLLVRSLQLLLLLLVVSVGGNTSKLIQKIFQSIII